jgi:hypothetical protein
MQKSKKKLRNRLFRNTRKKTSPAFVNKVEVGGTLTSKNLKELDSIQDTVNYHDRIIIDLDAKIGYILNEIKQIRNQNHLNNIKNVMSKPLNTINTRAALSKRRTKNLTNVVTP